MNLPRVIHVTPFMDLSGANRAMLTLVAEMARLGPAFVFAQIENEVTDEARKIGAIVETAHGDAKFPSGRVKKFSRFVSNLRKAVKTHQIDVIHSHSAIGNHYCWPVKLLTGRPLVTHQRDNYKKDYFHFGLGAADHIIAVSHWIKKNLPPRLAEKTTAIHDGVEIASLDPPPPRVGPIRIGMAGRCWPQKGHDLVIDAAAMLVGKYDLEVNLWGLIDNEFSNMLRSKVAALPPEVRARFHLEGFRSDVETFYGTSDIVVIPSRYPDPFPRMVTEAMTRYKPVIVAATGGMVEIVDDGETGLTFKSDDAADLARQIERLLIDPALRERLSRAGRAAVQARLAPDVYLRQVNEIYQRVLAGR